MPDHRSIGAGKAVWGRAMLMSLLSAMLLMPAMPTAAGEASASPEATTMIGTNETRGN